MHHKTYTAVLLCLFMLVGCQTAPKTKVDRDILVKEARQKLGVLEAKNKRLYTVYDKSSVAVAVFPTVGDAGLLVGYGYGKGALFEGGEFVGYCDVNEGKAGAIIGAKVRSQFVFIQDELSLAKFKRGDVELTAQVSAIAAKSEATRQATYKDGFALIAIDSTGLMAEASVSGQKFRYVAKDAVE